jgi:hypothetical protein
LLYVRFYFQTVHEELSRQDARSARDSKSGAPLSWSRRTGTSSSSPPRENATTLILAVSEQSPESSLYSPQIALAIRIPLAKRIE